jgi:hypothetical protein
MQRWRCGCRVSKQSCGDRRARAVGGHPTHAAHRHSHRTLGQRVGAASAGPSRMRKALLMRRTPGCLQARAQDGARLALCGNNCAACLCASRSTARCRRTPCVAGSSAHTWLQVAPVVGDEAGPAACGCGECAIPAACVCGLLQRHMRATGSKGTCSTTQRVCAAAQAHMHSTQGSLGNTHRHTHERVAAAVA